MIFENDKPLKECYGVLYDENNNETYKGMLYEERPKEGKNITIYDIDSNKIYTGDFYNFKFNGKGTLFYKEKEELYKIKKNRIHFKGMFKNDLYENGILYDPQGNIVFEGSFLNDIFEKRKISDLEGYLQYEGKYYKSKYFGFGKLYGGYQCKSLIYEGFFKDGLYEGKGILKDNYLYEYVGSFKEGKYHGYGILNNYIGKNKYLYYVGNFNSGNFEGKGELYYRGNEEVGYFPEIMYSGMFKNNEINGEGIKYYKNGRKKYVGIFETINLCKGIYYSPFGDKLYQGNIINERPEEDIYNKIYDDGGILYEGKIKNGKYEGEGIEYSNCIKDKAIYYGNFSNDYFIDTNIAINKNELSSNVILISDDDNLPGKTKLFERIIYNKYDESKYWCTLNFSYDSLNYIYHQNKYDIHIYDSARDCRRYMNLWLIRFYKPLIIIYVFNLKRQYEERISEDFIDQIIHQKENQYIYLVGTRLDDFDGDLIIIENKLKI